MLWKIYLLRDDILYTDQSRVRFGRVVDDTLVEVLRTVTTEVMCFDMTSSIISSMRISEMV